MTSPRNLVLLLSSGHTVRIALRDGDLTQNGGPTMFDLREFLTMLPAVVVGGGEPESAITFAYIEDPSLPDFLPGGGMEREPLNDHQRISIEGPGAVVQHG